MHATNARVRSALITLLAAGSLGGIGCATPTHLGTAGPHQSPETTKSPTASNSWPLVRYRNLPEGIVTDADNGLTLTAYVGTTILVDIGGASLPSLNTSGVARAYVQPRSSDIAVLVPIPDPECP